MGWVCQPSWGGSTPLPRVSASCPVARYRYKMTCEYTWPNHLLGSDRAATSALLEQHGLQGDVAFGHSKLFIRSPQTLVTLEQSRARLIPIIVLLLQKVRPHRMPTWVWGDGCTPGGKGRGECASGGKGGVAVHLGGGEGWVCTPWSWGVCTWGDGRGGCAPPGVGGGSVHRGAHRHTSRHHRNPLQPETAQN